MNTYDIRTEIWREYDFGDRVYRIEHPVTLYWEAGHTCHRIVDENDVVHCCPAPGINGCVLRWKSHADRKPVAF